MGLTLEVIRSRFELPENPEWDTKEGVTDSEIRDGLKILEKAGAIEIFEIPDIEDHYLADPDHIARFLLMRENMKHEPVFHITKFGEPLFRKVLRGRPPEYRDDNAINAADSVDRYVSVTDNSDTFYRLSQQLDLIRDEFAKDHNRGEYKDLRGRIEFEAELAATQAQIKVGAVRRSQIAESLKGRLRTLLRFAAGYATLRVLLEDLLTLLNELASLL